MIKKWILIFSALCYSSILFSQVSDSTWTSKETFEVADVSPQFPGGYEAFYKFIRRDMIYPASARLAGIEGRVFISFIINASGFIESNSVKTVQSLYPACDREAERVIKACNAKWIPATKNGRSIRQLQVVPIVFRLVDNLSFNNCQTITPIKSTIKEKPAKSRNPTWGIYNDVNMTNSIGEVKPGDSITVVGCAPWLFAVKNKSVLGYISYRAVVITPELEELIKIIEEESPKQEAAIRKRDSLKKIEWQPVVEMTNLPSIEELNFKKQKDSIEFSQNAHVFLRLTSSKKKMYIGECAVINLTLYISVKNKLRLQFINLNDQLVAIINNKLNKNFCWMASNNIQDVRGVDEKIGDTMYTVYALFSASYCPMKIEPISFQPINLQIAQIKEDGSIGNVLTYTTKPLSITVRPLPQSISVTSSDYHKLVGKFVVDDSIKSKSVAVGEPVKYSITIKGNGLTFPLSPPTISKENITSKLIDLHDSDTIINDVYYSSKTFSYSLKFKTEGEYDLSNILIFSAYDYLIESVSSFRTKAKVLVLKEAETSFPQEEFPHFVMDNIIALDASASMMFQDYSPNRLESATEGLGNFLVNRKKCDVGLILFGGNAIQYNLMNNDTCYSSNLIHSINSLLVKPRTSIGDAIWLAINSTSKSNSPKKLIIIGDGDNTTGFLNPETASEMAKKHNIKIYTIGIGKTGTFQIGTQADGQPINFESVFSNKVLTKISLLTGGKYYWAKDSESITKILREIFLL